MKNLSDTFRILGAEPRLKIVSLLLKSSPLCVSAITEQLNMSQSAVSQHLRVLKMGGWVEAVKKG
ncbi:MAG: ArsR/SmtB family transcription factor, partial [bacterium]